MFLGTDQASIAQSLQWDSNLQRPHCSLMKTEPFSQTAQFG